MSSCTFWGHHDCPHTVKEQLREVLTELITQRNVTQFYVGHQGQFDAHVRTVLRELQKEYSHIQYAVVLAYMPGKQTAEDQDTMLPEGIELVHPRYAISWRNNWTLRQADYVVAYITHSWGGAAKYAAAAQKQGKHIINIASAQNNPFFKAP